jgi:pimeloyl-ACP methyl ester carboxylesterase
MLPYVEPGRLVDIGGRRINLHCTGAGGPTVILMAGLFSWSVVWYKTQPVIAQRTRVCAFDRAGYGFSDPGPRPQILSDVVDDLHAALNAGPIPGPYVLVGHSLGGIETRLYAQRWPKEVVGMVLVDTSPAGEGLIDENQPGFDEVIGRESYAADISPQFFTAYYFADKVSLMSSLYTHRYDSVDHRRLGAMPLVVLSVENTWNNNTPAGVLFNRSYSKWITLHEALAHLSSRGVHRMIEGSGHEIQLDKPQAVIDAVDEVFRQLRAGAKP